jgi:beta-lactamase superfamily II metal-dependent hydrolase
MPLSSGARIGRYEILSPLGAGDIGEVCRAKETKLGPETAPPSVLVGGTPGLVLRSVIRVTVCCVLASAALLPTMSAQQTSKPLDIYVVDVDGGESTLFVSPSGESMLVDAGWPGFDGRDARRIAAVAHEAGVQRIDYLVVTHFHADHMGGVPPLAARLPIRHVIDHGADVQRGPSAAAAFKPYDDLRRSADGIEARPGYLIPISGFTAHVIAAGGSVLPAALPDAGAANPSCADFKPQDVPPGQEEIRAEDARSVSLLITFGRFRAVIMGDLGWNLERDLMCPNSKVPPVDLYLVSHHGSDTSGSPALVYALKPRVAVMNNGAVKGGALQTFQILKASLGLEDLWQNHYSIVAGPELNRPENFIANLEPRVASEKTPTGQMTAPLHMGPANGIKISAAHDGGFTVTNSRNGYSKRYRQQS